MVVRFLGVPALTCVTVFSGGDFPSVVLTTAVYTLLCKATCANIMLSAFCCISLYVHLHHVCSRYEYISECVAVCCIFDFLLFIIIKMVIRMASNFKGSEIVCRFDQLRSEQQICDVTSAAGHTAALPAGVGVGCVTPGSSTV